MWILILHRRKLTPWEEETQHNDTKGEEQRSNSNSRLCPQRSKIKMTRLDLPACKGQYRPHLLSRMGPIFCRDLATLKRTLATGSPAIRKTVGSMCFVVMSCPQTSDSTWDEWQRGDYPKFMANSHFLLPLTRSPQWLPGLRIKLSNMGTLSPELPSQGHLSSWSSHLP